MIKIIIQKTDGQIEIINTQNPVDAEVYYFENCIRRFDGASAIKINGSGLITDAYYRLDAGWDENYPREQNGERFAQIWASPVISDGRVVIEQHAKPTPEQVRAVLKILNWSGSQAGMFFGVDSRQIRRYTSGEQTIGWGNWREILRQAKII